jgi:preprotein translocase subunit SecG
VGIVTVLFLVICVMMILTVLIQRPQGGGLSGAFGSGAGSGQTAFGAKTGDALTIFTIIVFVLFLGLAISLNYGYRPTVATPGAAVIEAGSKAPAGKGNPGSTGAGGNTAPTDAAPSNSSGQPEPAPVQPAPAEQAPATPPPAQPSPQPSDQPK